MSSKNSLTHRLLAVCGLVFLAMGAPAGLAAAQTGPLDTIPGLDFDAVLERGLEVMPETGSLDEAVSAGQAAAAAGPDLASPSGSADVRNQDQQALPPPAVPGLTSEDSAAALPTLPALPPEAGSGGAPGTGSPYSGIDGAGSLGGVVDLIDRAGGPEALGGSGEPGGTGAAPDATDGSQLPALPTVG